MGEQLSETRSILARLERVERENRKLKRMGLGAMVLAGAVLLMAQARPNRTIEAEKFVLKDASGRTRARLEMQLADRPTLVLLDANGFPLVSLGAGESPFLSLCKSGCEDQAQLGTFSDDTFGLAIFGKDKGPFHGLRAAFGVVNNVPGVNLYGEGDSTDQASLDLEAPGPRLLLSDRSGNVSLEKASVELSDGQGFRTKIGSTELETLRTGETHKTSAASIVLFGKDGKELWSAP